MQIRGRSHLLIEELEEFDNVLICLTSAYSRSRDQNICKRADLHFLAVGGGKGEGDFQYFIKVFGESLIRKKCHDQKKFYEKNLMKLYYLKILILNHIFYIGMKIT